MSEASLEVARVEEAVKEVETSEKGEPLFKRYSFKGIKSELKEISWLSKRDTFLSLGLVVGVALLLIGLTYGLDQLFSTAVLSLYQNVQAFPAWVTVILVVLQVTSASATLFFALKHPSPGDTLASIFGGQMVAQGSGLSPREKRLEKKMAVSAILFFILTLLLGLTL